MRTLPAKLPSAYVLAPGVSSISTDADVGGYDIMIDGHGFRLATDQQFAYQRATEETTTHRFDTSLEPGEQSLSVLPWIKSQSSFHGGAGQLNLEQGFTSFQYQQEQIEHIRFDNCIGVNVWTPGQVTRLPDTHFFNFGFSSIASVAATVSGVDYAIIGGNGGLYQAAWLSGPDASPTVTQIDLTGSTFVSNANCKVTSLATDGVNYYGVVQMTSAGFVANVLTYIISGSVSSTAAPTALYEVPNTVTAPTRHNLCPNPSFETDTVGWAASGTPTPTIARVTTQHFVGAAALQVTSSGADTFFEGHSLTLSGLTIGQTYTASCYLLNPSSNGTTAGPGIFLAGTSLVSARVTTRDVWTRVSLTFTATATSHAVNGFGGFTAGSQVYYVDACLVETGAVLGSYFDGSNPPSGYAAAWDGTTNDSTSTATASLTAQQEPGIVGWVKSRLVGCMGNALYELSPTAAPHAALPSPRYTHPLPQWTWTATAESPNGILASGSVGNQASVLQFVLDSSGATPFLAGGSAVVTLPAGESILSMTEVIGSFLALGTSSGIRNGTFDTYTGTLKMGPLTLNTKQPVLAVATRDRFVYGSFTNQQADGKTGLVAVDLSMVVDAAGRNAYSPDLRPPTAAPTGLGAVTSISVLPQSNRLVFLTAEGIHVEGNGPGSDGDAWIKTSRIRYDTSELKLFKLGRVHGSLDVANIQVTGIAPFQSDQNLGTFGFVSNGDPGEFRLPSGLHEWIQLKFDLQGSACVLNTYQVKAYPAPAQQQLIVLTVNCFRDETDRYGLDVTDPETPRQRLQNIINLKSAGTEVRYVEFTNEGSVAQLVLLDQYEFKSFSRPNIEDDLGGYITMRLRATEG